MALVSASLQAAFLRFSTTQKPGSPTEAANNIASAYEQYALTATAGPGMLVSPGPARAAMAQPLAAAFSMSPGVPATVAAAYAAMLTSFWGAATFVGPGPGIAAPPIGVGVLIPLVTTILLNTNNTAASYAQQMATALDTCTKTVLVTYTLPPPAPPIIAPVS